MTDTPTISESSTTSVEESHHQQMKYSKLKGLELIESGILFDRDAKRLDAKARAVYKQLGLELDEIPDSVTVVCDNVHNISKKDINDLMGDEDDRDVRIVADNITFRDDPAPTPTAPVEPTQSTSPTPKPEDISRLAKWVISVALLAGGLGLGGSIPFILNWLTQPQQEFQDTDTDTRRRLTGMPE